MRGIPVGLLAALASGAAAGARAQTPIHYGQVVTGRLSGGAPVLGNDTHYEVYAFPAGEGDRISVGVHSQDFDTRLLLTDAAGNRIAADDDGGGECNSWLATTIPAAGSYYIFVNALYPDDVGSFELSLASPSLPPPSNPATCRAFAEPTGTIHVGDVMQDSLSATDPTLSDANPYHSWVLPTTANQTLTVDLMSDAFDAHLMLMTPRGEVIAQNDDGAGGCNARVVHTSPDDHPLRVLVTSQGPGQGGYTLAVRVGTSPLEHGGGCGTVVTPSPEAGPTTEMISDIGQLDVGARFLRLDREYRGALAETDPIWAGDTSRVQAWAIEGVAGDSVHIDLLSDAFDAFLWVLGPGLEETLRNDDGAGGCNSRISFAFPRSGVYRVVVNHIGQPDTGVFTLRVTSSPGPADSTPCQGTAATADPSVFGALPVVGRLQVERPVSGELTTADVLYTDGTRLQAWALAGTFQETVTVELRSDDFDAYLHVSGPGIPNPLHDDDSGGRCNARITITFPQTGVYRAVVNTIEADQTGGFTLFATANPGPRNPTACQGGGRVGAAGY